MNMKSGAGSGVNVIIFCNLLGILRVLSKLAWRTRKMDDMSKL